MIHHNCFGDYLCTAHDIYFHEIDLDEKNMNLVHNTSQCFGHLLMISCAQLKSINEPVYVIDTDRDEGMHVGY